MAKLHFFYSTMNAGKSTSLLQTNYNFEENNHKTLLFLPNPINKKNNKIKSRIGIEKDAILVNAKFNFYKYVKKMQSTNLKCILVDESQFLKSDQVNQLSRIADDFDILVMCYGLRTNFKGELFEGSSRLLAIADDLHELKTICTLCENKATMVLRYNNKGVLETMGKTIKIGGNDIYKSVCRYHFRKKTKLI